jgi:dTDP-4-amino-4,6-dideoxygalactose transaminase
LASVDVGDLERFYRDRYGYTDDSFPVASREFRRLVSLPIYPAMSDDDVQDVIDAVKRVLSAAPRA